MALIKLGLGFSAIKGKINGTVFQGYRGKVMASTLVSGGGTKTEHWQKVKIKFGIVATAWRSLDVGKKLSWAEFAPQFLFTDKFGDQYQGSGYQCFMSLNSNLVQAGFPLVLTPPTSVEPTATPSGEEVEVIGMQDKSLSPSLGYDKDFVLQIWASNPGSPNALHPPQRFKYLGAIGYESQTPFDVTEAFSDVYGYKDTPDTTSWYKLRVLHTPTGFASPFHIQKLHFVFKEQD